MVNEKLHISNLLSQSTPKIKLFVIANAFFLWLFIFAQIMPAMGQNAQIAIDNSSIQFIYQTARLHRILIKVEKGLIQGIGTIVGVGELL